MAAHPSENPPGYVHELERLADAVYAFETAKTIPGEREARAEIHLRMSKLKLLGWEPGPIPAEIARRVRALPKLG